MNKLLVFGAAALCATVGLADITSANIVGYQELGTDATGKMMVVPTFLNVGESNKWSLADLKVTGYTAPSKNSKGKWVNGCQGGAFIAEKLSTFGTREAAYYWIENGTVGPGWFADETGKAIEGGAESIKFDAGTGFWTKGTNYKLVPAGAVNQNDVAYKTDATGKVAVGNSMPIDLTLADLTVTGYTAPSKNSKGKWVNGCQGGAFIAEKLSTFGTREKAYYWIENGTVGPGWFADETGKAIEGGAENVKLPYGQGLWVKGTGYTLEIPAPEL